MSDPSRSTGNPVDDALLKLMGDLAGVAKAVMPAREGADDASLAMVAQLLGVTPAELLNAPEKAAGGVMGLIDQLRTFVEGSVSADADKQSDAQSARAAFEAVLGAHGRDASGPIDQLGRALKLVSGKDDRLDQRVLAGGLRKLADAFEGKASADPAGDGAQIEALREALETIGQDLVGVDPVKEAAARKAELQAAAASDIDEVFKGLGLD
jgi:primase-polymerase (primpol)-like protein